MSMNCIQCPKLGKICRGPDFFSMSPQEVLAWLKAYKKHMGITNAKLAEMCGMAQGTVDSLFANSHADFKYSTILPIIRALIGSLEGDACADHSGSAEAKERIRQLEADLLHKDDTIRHYEDQIASMKTLVTNTNARYTKQAEELRAMIKDQNERHAQSQDFLRDQIKNRNKAVKILAFAAGIGWLIIIVALVIDKLYPHLGFFWRDFASLFSLDWPIGRA